MPQKESGYNRLLWEVGKSHPFGITAVILLNLFGMMFAIVSPLIMRLLIDDVLIGKNTSFLIQILVAVSGIFVVSAISSYYSIRIKGTLDLVLFKELSSKVFLRVHKIDLKDIQQLKTGDLQFRTTGNVGSIIQTVTNTLPQILITVLGIFLPVVIMFSLDSKIAMIVLSPVFLFIISSWYFGDKIRAVQKPALDSNASLQSFLKEAYSIIPLIKVFRLENWINGKYDRKLTAYTDSSVDVVKVISMSSTISMLIYGVPSILVLTLGSMAVMQNTMTIGTLTAFMGYVALFFSPIQQLSSLWNNFKSSQASYDRVNDLLELKTDMSNNKPFSIVKGEIQFEGVWFSYDDRTILKDFNVTFAHGRNFVIGENGSGKTTLIKLLCGLYVPDRGRIVIDGYDLRQMSRDYLWTSVSVVFSDALIFDGTIYENILLGNLSATKDDVFRAAKKAELHDFIMKLPKQYNTDVGESGLNLSSGEKQKIALARVILRDSPIIIFDEFTRSIDAESKKSIYSVIRQLANKTIIIITHDLNDIEKNSKVVILGKDTISATHDSIKVQQVTETIVFSS